MQGSNHPDANTLRRIRSLSRFDDQQLQHLATQLEIETVEAGSCLVELGDSDNSSLYLLEGALQGITNDGQETQFASAGDGELQPIAEVRPSIYRIVATEPARFFKLNTDQLTAFAHEASESTTAAGSEPEPLIIDDDTEQSMFEIQLFRDLLEGELKLPSLPDVAQRIEQAYADNLVTPETVVVIIQSDPVITAKMIMIANSALFGGRAPIDSLRQAIVRLGLENTRKMVMTFVVRDLFESKTSSMRTHMQAAWKHSMHVASLCRVLAERLGGWDVEQAQLAGLVHDIGEVAILQYAQQNDELRDNPEKLGTTIKAMRPQITGMLLQEWNFGSDFVSVGQECENWFRNPADHPDLCDLVLIAQYHAMIGTPQQRSLPPIATLPAFEKLGMGNLAIEEIVEFLKQSRERIEEIEGHLGSL